MYDVRRWWGRNWLRSVLAIAALGLALGVRQGQAGFLMEAYRALTLPLHLGAPSQNDLADARVQELQQRLEELESRNAQLQTLLNYRKTLPAEGTVAPVIGRSADRWWQQITLGRGTADGIQQGSIVMAPGGVVGRVTAVTSHTSRVLLVSDPGSRIGVSVARSRYMGYLRGKSDRTATVEFFDKLPDVKPGDAIVTSAYSQFFPAGLPIGRVVAIDTKKALAPEATIELSAPLSTLEWVTVLPHDPALFRQFQDPLPPPEESSGTTAPAGGRPRATPSPQAATPSPAAPPIAPATAPANAPGSPATR
ncbi:MAG TPA: rod shape-determining protein MreC [Coleofasciculaceae cyanobacterium]